MKIAAETTAGRSEPTLEGALLETLSDADLLDAWTRDQHAPALATLVKRYSVMVLSVCRRRCRTDADTDDAFQSTFLYLARNSSKIRSPERLPGWLHRVAQRAAMATWKTLPRQTEPMVEPPADPDDPLDRLTQRHEALVLDEELADLPEHYRAALVMHIYEGQPLQQLAEHFGTTIGSIRGRLQRGKQMLARKLRQRGVVPVLAFAAANSWSATEAAAVSASDTFIASVSGGVLPKPPIDPALHQSLLSHGVPLMPTLYTTAGIVGGTALLALILSSTSTTVGQSSGGTQTFDVSPRAIEQPRTSGQRFAVAQLRSAQVAVDETNDPPNPPDDGGGVAGGSSGGGGALAGGQGGSAGALNSGVAQTPAGIPVGGNPAVAPSPPPNAWKVRPVVPEATTQTAQKAIAALDTETTTRAVGSLNVLADTITNIAGVPVLIDQRGLAFAEIEPESQVIHLDVQQVPLRTAIRKALQPLGLRVVVEDEGMVITADPAALVHQGIGVARWINVDDQAAEQICSKLDQTASVSFLESPLSDALQSLQEQYELPIWLDRRALDDIGLDGDQPVSLELKDVKLGSALTMMLAEHDLVTTLRGETLVVTTNEEEEDNLLHRIYWLEGTGVAPNDPQTLIETIKTTIAPNAWSEMGGPSTIVSMGSNRPALIVSATFQTHQDIEKLLDALRQTHFGVDPVLENVLVPATQPAGGMGGFGGMGGGMGGMGGGMGGMGGGMGGMGGGMGGGGGFF